MTVVAGAFPPTPNAPATRAHGLASGLARVGHPVTVVTSRTNRPGPDLTERLLTVCPTGWIDVVSSARRLGLHRTRVGTPRTSADGQTRTSALVELAGKLAVPDMYFTWIPSATREAYERLDEDAVLLSTGPVSGHVVGRLSKGNRPWVADLNDLWWKNPFRPEGAVREQIDHLVERSTLGKASAFITVNDSTRAELERRYGRPAYTLWSGFFPEDFPTRETPTRSPAELLYVGSLYPTFSLSPLLAAIEEGAQAGWLTPETLRIRFIGAGTRRFLMLATEHGVGDVCSAEDLRDRPAVLAEMARATALLLPVYREQPDILPMRFFEYVGAGRPIVALGSRSGLAARLVKEKGLGVTASDAGEMVPILRQLAQEPESMVPAPQDVRSEFRWQSRIVHLSEILDAL